ncbi:MAG: pilus assembly protein PilM [Burkholderiaceae bacterium]
MALSLSGIFGKKLPPLVGIDLSSSSVKLVELGAGDRSSMRLERYAIEPIEKGAIVDGAIEKPEVVSEALRKAMRKANIKSKNVALALPSAAVITKNIMLPADLREEDYEVQVESEASQYIPFPIEEVNLDFQILGPNENAPDEVDVLLAASRKEKVEDRVAIAEMAGVNPVVVDVEPYAVRATVDHVTSFLPNGGQGQIIAVVVVGQNATFVSIVLNGQTIFEREQSLGGQQLTQDIVRMYGITAEEAEVKKRTGDLPDTYHEDLLKPFVAQGATDISRALQFFFTSTPYSRVDQIYLAGGSAVIPGFVEQVAEETQVPTDLIAPFQGMEVDDSIREKQLRVDAPSLMVATGLAMRRFES